MDRLGIPCSQPDGSVVHRKIRSNLQERFLKEQRSVSYVADSRSKTLGGTSTKKNDFPSEPQSHSSAPQEINIIVTGFMSLLPWATRINTGR